LIATSSTKSLSNLFTAPASLVFSPSFSTYVAFVSSELTLAVLGAYFYSTSNVAA